MRENREHQEYKKVQMEHQRAFELKQISGGIRDRIIQTYRQEIESNKLNERDFSNLIQQIEDLKRRRDALEASVETLKGDYDAQIQSQKNVMDSLNHELQILKNQNDDKQSEAAEVQQQTQTVKIEITERDKEIRESRQEIQTVVAHDQAFERENENFK
mmetsp:Transcript_10060/g.16955  ORF Transcript_10060/g.16955 Transcript_10060/m.16955 type:complete len:159 (+) Transcript_10060:1119-1595(+)